MNIDEHTIKSQMNAMDSMSDEQLRSMGRMQGKLHLKDRYGHRSLDAATVSSHDEEHVSRTDEINGRNGSKNASLWSNAKNAWNGRRFPTGRKPSSASVSHQRREVEST